MPVVSGFDLSLPFQIEAGHVRGRLVRLAEAVDAVVVPHALPAPVAGQLAETVALAAGLAGGLKYDGIFTLQIQADGAIPLLVADVTSTGDLRAYARFDAERLARAEAAADVPALPRYFGKGFVAFTVDQGPDTERYQGIVELAGNSLADAVESYLSRSEQLPSGIVTAVAPPRDGSGWRAAALTVQRMPPVGHSPILTREQADEDWNRALILARSVYPAEMLDLDLPPHALLRRLFHAEALTVYPPRPLQACCRCSRERVETTLRSFPAADLAELWDENGCIDVACEFCKTHYIFTRSDLPPA